MCIMNIKLRFQGRRRSYQCVFEAEDRHRRIGRHVSLTGREPSAAGLSGEADDERGPEGDAGDDLPGLRNGIPDQGDVPPPVHGREDRVVAVLDGDIQVAADFSLVRDRPEKLFRETGGVGVEEADP